MVMQRMGTHDGKQAPESGQGDVWLAAAILAAAAGQGARRGGALCAAARLVDAGVES